MKCHECGNTISESERPRVYYSDRFGRLSDVRNDEHPTLFLACKCCEWELESNGLDFPTHEGERELCGE